MVTEICIVGGGLAGLSCALSLAKTAAAAAAGEDNECGKNNRIHITLIELRSFRSKGATFGFALSGQKAMKEICPKVLEELQEIGIFMPSTGAYMLPWSHVRDGLLAKVRELPSNIITVLEDTQVTSIVPIDDDDPSSPVIVEALQTSTMTTATTIEEEKEEKKDDIAAGDSVTTTTRVVREGKKISLQADIVIGADGLHSAVRKFIPEARSPIPSGKYVWRGIVEKVPPEISHLLTDIDMFTSEVSENTFVVIFNYHAKIPGTLCWVVSSSATGPYPNNSALECLEFIQDETRRNEFRSVLEASSQEELEYKTDLCTVPLDSDQWPGKGRLTLIGDAAHAIRPASGLGGSLAFEDVVVLTRQLEPVLFPKQEQEMEGTNIMAASGGNDPVIAALREFEKLRLPRCKAIQDDQNRVAEASYSQSKEALKKLEWTPEYKEWVFKGPNASPHPPAAIYVG